MLQPHPTRTTLKSHQNVAPSSSSSNSLPPPSGGGLSIPSSAVPPGGVSGPFLPPPSRHHHVSSSLPSSSTQSSHVHGGGGARGRGGGGAVPFSSLSASSVQNVNLGPGGTTGHHHHLRMHGGPSNGPASYGGGGPGMIVTDGALAKTVGGAGAAPGFGVPPSMAPGGLGLVHPALAMLHAIGEQDGSSVLPGDRRDTPVIVAMEHLGHGDSEMDKDEEAEGMNGNGDATGFHTDVLDFSGATVYLHQVLLLGEGEKLHPLLDFEGKSCPSPRDCEIRCYARLVPSCDEYTKTKKTSRNKREAARQRNQDRPVFRRLRVNTALLEFEKKGLYPGQRSLGSWLALGDNGRERGDHRENTEGEEDLKENDEEGGVGRLLRVDQIMFCGNYKALSVVVLGEVQEANTANRSILNELQMQACRSPASSSFLDVSFPSPKSLATSSSVSKTTRHSSSSSLSSPDSLEASLPSEFPVLLGIQSPPSCAVDASNRLQELLHEHLLAPVQERLSVWMATERERKRKLLGMKKIAEEEIVPHGKETSSLSAKQEESAVCPSAASTEESYINAEHQGETEDVAGGKTKATNDSESNPTSSPRLPRASLSMSVDRHQVEGPVEGEEATGAEEGSEPREGEGGIKQKDAVGGGEEGHVVTVKARDEDELSVDYGSSPRTPSGKADDERFTSSLGEDEGKHSEAPHTPSPRPSESVPDSDSKTPSSVPTRVAMKETASTATEADVKDEDLDGGGGSPAETREVEKNDASAVSDTSPCARSERNLDGMKCSSREPSVPSSLAAESSTSPPSSSSSPPKKSGTEPEEQTTEFSPRPPCLTIPVPPASFWAEVLRLLSQIYEGMTSPNDQISSSFFKSRLSLPPPMLRLLTAAACGVLKTLVLSPASRMSLRRMLLRKRGRRVRTTSGGEARTSCDKGTSRGEEDEDGGRRSGGSQCATKGRDVGEDSREEEWLSGGSAGVDAAREVVRLLGLEGPVLEVLSKFHGEKNGSRGNETTSRKREDPGETGENSCAGTKAEEEPEGKEKPDVKKQSHEESQDMLRDRVEALDQAQTDHPDEEKATKESNGSAQEDQPGVPESSEKEEKNREGSGEVALLSSTHPETEPSTAESAVGISSASPAAERASAPLCLSFSLHPESSHLVSDPVGSTGLSLYRGSLLLLLVMKTLRRLAVLEEVGSQLVREGACELLVSVLLEVPVWGNRGVNLNDLTEGIRGSGSEDERITARGWKVKVEAFKGLVVLVSHVAGMERLLAWDRTNLISPSLLSSSTFPDASAPPSEMPGGIEAPEGEKSDETNKSDVKSRHTQMTPTSSLYSLVLGAMASQLSFSRYHLKRLAAILLSRVKLYHAVAAFQQASLTLLSSFPSEKEGKTRGSSAVSSSLVSSASEKPAGEGESKPGRTPSDDTPKDGEASQHPTFTGDGQPTEMSNGTEKGKEKQQQEEGGERRGGEADEKKFLATFSFKTTRISQAGAETNSENKKKEVVNCSLPSQLLERGDAWVEAVADATRALSLQILHHTLPPSAVAASRDERVEMELFWPFACRPWSAAGLSLSFFPTIPMYLLSYARGRLFLSSLAFVSRCLYTRVSLMLCPNAADLRLLSAVRGLLLLLLRCANGPLFFASTSLHLTRSLLYCLDAFAQTLLSRASLLPGAINSLDDVLSTSPSSPYSHIWSPPFDYLSLERRPRYLGREDLLFSSFSPFSSLSSSLCFPSTQLRNSSPQIGFSRGGISLQTELLRKRGVWGLEGAGTPEDFIRQSGPADQGGFEGLVPSKKDEEAAVMALHIAAATRVHLRALMLVEKLLEGRCSSGVGGGREGQEEDNAEPTAYVDVSVVQALTSLASCPGGREAVAAAFRLRQADLFLLHLFSHLVSSLTRLPDGEPHNPENSKAGDSSSSSTTLTGSHHSSRRLDDKQPEWSGGISRSSNTARNHHLGPGVLMQLSGPSAELLVALRSVFLLIWELVLEDTFATFLVVAGPFLLACLHPLAVVGGIVGADGEILKAGDEKENKESLTDEGFGALSDPSFKSFVQVHKPCDWKTVLSSDRRFFRKLASLHEALACLYFPSDAGGSSSSISSLPPPSSLFLSAPCSLPSPPSPRVLIDALQCTDPPCSLRILQATAAAAAAAAAGGSAGTKPSTVAPTGAGPQETGVVGGAGVKASGSSTAALLFGGIEGGQGAELIDIAWAPDLPDAKSYAALLKEPEKANEKPEENSKSLHTPGWEIPGDVPPQIAPLKALLASRFLTLYVRRCPHVLLFANAEDSSFLFTEDLPFGESSKCLDDDAGGAVFGGCGSLDEHGLTALERSVLPPPRDTEERQESVDPSSGGGVGAARMGEEFGLAKISGLKKEDTSLSSIGQKRGRQEGEAENGDIQLISRDDLFSSLGLKDGVPIHSGVGRLLLTPEAQKALLSCLARCVASLAPSLGNLATMADWQVRGGSMYRWIESRRRTLPTARALLVLFYNVLHGLTCPAADDEEEESVTGPLGYRNIELLQLLLLLVSRLLAMSEWVGGADWSTEARAVVAALAASTQRHQQVKNFGGGERGDQVDGAAENAGWQDIKVKGEQEVPSSVPDSSSASGDEDDRNMMSLLALLSPLSTLYGERLFSSSFAADGPHTVREDRTPTHLHSLGRLGVDDEVVSSRWISGMEVSGHEELCLEIRLSLAWACRLFFLWFQNFPDSQSFLVRHVIRFGAASVPELQHAALLLFTSLASFSAILPAAPHTFHILPSSRRPPVCGGGVTAVELATAAKEAEKAKKGNTSEGLSATVAAMLPPSVTLSARVYSLLEMLTMQYRTRGGGEAGKKARNRLGLAEDPEALPLYFCCEIDLTDELEAAVSASASATSLGASAVFGRLTMGDEGVVAMNDSGVVEQSINKGPSSQPGSTEPLEDPADLLRMLREILWGSASNSGNTSSPGSGGDDDKGEGDEGDKNGGGEVAWLRKWQREAETIRVEELVVLVTLVSRSAVASSPSLHSLGVHAAALLAAHRFPVYSLLFECMDTLLDTVLQNVDPDSEASVTKQEERKKEEEKQSASSSSSKGEEDLKIRRNLVDTTDDLTEVFAFVASSPATDCARHLCRLLLFIEHLVALQAKASSSSLSELQRLVSLPSTRLLQVCLSLLSSPGLLAAAEAHEYTKSYHIRAKIQGEHSHAKVTSASRSFSSSMEMKALSPKEKEEKMVSSKRSFSSVGPVAAPLLRCALRLATNILVSYQRLVDLAKQAVESSDGSSGGSNTDEQGGESIEMIPNHLGLVRKITEAVCALCNRPHPKGPGGLHTLGLALGFLVALGSHPFTLLTATFDLPHHSTEALLLPLRGEAHADATAVAAGANSALRLASFVQKTSDNVKAAAQNLHDCSTHLWLALASRLLLLVEMVLTHASHPVAPLFSLLQHDEEALPFWASLDQDEENDIKGHDDGGEGEELQERKAKSTDEEAIDDLDIYEDLQPPGGSTISQDAASSNSAPGTSQADQTLSLPGSTSRGASLPRDSSKTTTTERRSTSHKKDYRGNLLRPLRAALQTLLSQCQLILASSQLHGVAQRGGGSKAKMLQAHGGWKDERDILIEEEKKKKHRILILARQAIILLSKTEDLDVRIGGLRLEPPPLLLAGSSFFPSDFSASTPSSRLRKQLYWGGEEAAWDVVAHCDAVFNVAVRRAAALTDPLLPVPAAQPIQDASLRLIVDAAVMARVLEGSQDWWCAVGVEAIRCQAQEDSVKKASEEDAQPGNSPGVPSDDPQQEKKGQGVRDDDDFPLWCSDPLLRFHVPFSVPPPVDCLSVAKTAGASLARSVGGHASGFPTNPAAAKAAAAAAAAAAVAAAVTAGRTGSQGRENASSDPFRSRAKASRRAPSKHVDDYEAAVPGGLTLQKKMPPPPPPPPPERPAEEEQPEPLRVEEKETKGTDEESCASTAAGGGGKTRSEEKFPGQPGVSEKPGGAGEFPMQLNADTSVSREGESAFADQQKKGQHLGAAGVADESRRNGFAAVPDKHGRQISQEAGGAFGVPDRLGSGGRGDLQTTGGAAAVGVLVSDGTQEPRGMTASHGGIQPQVRPTSHQLLIQQQLQQIQRAAQAREIEQNKVTASGLQQPGLAAQSSVGPPGGGAATGPGGESGMVSSQTVPNLTGLQQGAEQQQTLLLQQLQQHSNLQGGNLQAPQALGHQGVTSIPLLPGQQLAGTMQPGGGMLSGQGQKGRLETGEGKPVGMAVTQQQQQLSGVGQQIHVSGAQSFGSTRQLVQQQQQQPQIALSQQQSIQQGGGIAPLQTPEIRTTPDQLQLQGVVMPQNHLVAQGGGTAGSMVIQQHPQAGGAALPQQQGMYGQAQIGTEGVAGRTPQQPQGALVQQGGPGAFQVTAGGSRMAPSQAAGHLHQQMVMGRIAPTGLPGDAAGAVTAQGAQQPFGTQTGVGLGMQHQPHRQMSVPSSPPALPQHHAQVVGNMAPHQQLPMATPAGFAPPPGASQQLGGLMATPQLQRGATGPQQMLGLPSQQIAGGGLMQAPGQRQMNLTTLPQSMNQPMAVSGGVLPQQQTAVTHSQLQTGDAMLQGERRGGVGAVQQEQPQGDGADGNAGGGGLDACPGWKEFAADGLRENMDVTKLAQNPELLKDPRIKSRFIRLLNRHEQIKNLFRMLGLDL
ncbi:hypothetical protein CSUI_002948 [Cystoisospora suis]|uniref:Uncharacterized protein n=1 Tax=Cystoisospora suis TaxID=483139 RepID=A0A2C6L670_9APIC|nr:hypothetical protein CSUI_002948 [Cystoisospora suis]